MKALRVYSLRTHAKFGLPEFHIGVRTIQPQFWVSNDGFRRSQWPRGLRRGCEAARFLGLWVRITPEALMSLVSVVFQVEVSGSG